MRAIILTGCLIITFALSAASQPVEKKAITRGDTTRKIIALVMTGDEFGDGGQLIRSTLKKHNVKASFFLTGNFYRDPRFKNLIAGLQKDGHYLGSHSDKHLLYCDWEKRDSLLVTREEFTTDLANSYKELSRFSIEKQDAFYFLPPYEWFNDSIVSWTAQEGLQLINYTPGTRSTGDYTYPEMGNRYIKSKDILNSIIDYEKSSPSGLNGFILLMHIGTDPRRSDKFYRYLPQLISHMKRMGYNWVRIDELL
jgi:endoglucanase